MMLFAISLIGLVLRLIQSTQSFWLDEAASIEIASRSFTIFFTELKYDFHPPLFYLLLKFWLLISPHQEWLIRLPFIFIGVITIPVVYQLGLQVFGQEKRFLAYLSAFLLAINPLHLYYSQELRMYSLSTLFTALSWLLFLRIMTQKSKSLDQILFVLFSVLNLYTFYGAFLNLFAQFLYVIYKRQNTRRLINCFLVVALCFLPLLPTFMSQLESGGYLKTALPGWSALSGRLTPKDLLLVPLKMVTGRISLDPKRNYYLIGGLFTLLSFGLGLLSLKIKKIRPIYFWFFVPLGLACVVSLFSPMMGYWRFLFLLPAICLLVAAGIDTLPRSLKLLAMGSIIISSSMFIFVYYLVPSNQREDWRGLVSAISKEPSLIVINFPFTFAPLKYYNPQGEYFYTEQSLGVHKSDLVGELKEAAKGKQALYFLTYLEDLSDPNHDNLNKIIDAGFTPVTAAPFQGAGVVYLLKVPSGVK